MLTHTFADPVRAAPPTAADLRGVFLMTGVHTRQTQSQWSFPRHAHPYFELALLHHGEQHASVLERIIAQRPGEMLLVAPNEEHAFHTPVPSSLCCLHFDVDDLEVRRQLCLLGTGIVRSDAATAQRMRELIATIIACDDGLNTPTLTERLRASASLYSLLALLTSCQLDQQADRSARLSPPALEMALRLAKMIEHQVDSHGHETSIAAAMREMGYAPDYASAAFRQVFGFSPRQHRSNLKLARAKLLLLDTGLSVGDIGIKLGYSDGAHFSRQFKRWTGLAPHDFRNGRAAGATRTPAGMG